MVTFFILSPFINDCSDLLTTSTSVILHITLLKMKNINLSKKNNVTKVFNEVFNKYDLMNDMMSLGAHRIWKSKLLDWMKPVIEIIWLT